MSADFFEAHAALLSQAVEAAQRREYWSPYPEVPSPRVYGETAAEDGLRAFEAHVGQPFVLPGAEAADWPAQERSPWGRALDIQYPQRDADELIRRARHVQDDWADAGPRAWVGVAMETLQRLHRRSVEMAHAVQHTTGQGYMMAFQAGGPHALDRGLEAVAYAWQEMSRIPAAAQWVKPQGKHDPIRMEKAFDVVPRGVALVVGCSTFPTWNGYPGLFASLATGNPLVVKPHPSAILPLAIAVAVAREVLIEAGHDPDVVQLAVHAPDSDLPQRLALDPAVRLIDYTGSSVHGEWLEAHARQALVYTEKAGVNQIIIDSVADIGAVARNIAFSFALYSGQMCTAPQNIYVPRGGVRTPDGVLSVDEVVAALTAALDKLQGDPARAIELTGTLQSEATAHRVQAARALGLPVLRDSAPLAHPDFPQARTATTLLLRADAADASIRQEWFGPIGFVVVTDDTAHSLALAEAMVREHGALTLSVYTTDEAVRDQARRAARRAGVALSLNLTGAVFINQSAAFSDFHGTGANPAANAALTDAAFVAGRFRVVQTRWHTDG